MTEIYFINNRKYKFDILDENTLDFIKKYYNELDTKNNTKINNNEYSINNSTFIIKFILLILFIFIISNHIATK